MKFGSTLKRLRKVRKLTLSDIARISGIHLATLSRIENDKKIGTVRNHFDISKALGLKLSELYEEFERDNPLELSLSQIQ